MKRINILKLVLVLTIVFTSNVKAACSPEEQAIINDEVAKVRVTYEITQKTYEREGTETSDYEKHTQEYDVIQINIINVTENMIIEVSNDYSTGKNSKPTKYEYKDAKDGVISFISPSSANIINYEITVKTSYETECGGVIQRKIMYTQPKYNILSRYIICDEIPEFYLCKPYINFDEDITRSEFFRKAEKELEKKYKQQEEEKKKNQKWYDAVGDYIKEHKKLFIIGGTVLVVAAGTGTVLYVRKRRRDVI